MKEKESLFANAMSLEDFGLWAMRELDQINEMSGKLEERREGILDLVNKVKWGNQMGLNVTIFEVDGAVGVHLGKKPEMGFGT